MTHSELSAAGFPVSPDAYSRLARFVDALLDENSKLNLTAIRTAADIWPLHVCDSLALVPLLDEIRPRTLLDLGSGGGVPGIPLACVDSELRVTLLDATRKKVDAAGRIVAAIGLANVIGEWGRAEELCKRAEHRRRFDVVVARAVGKLPQLLPLVSGFIRPGGCCWLMKSRNGLEEEIASAASTAKKLGLQFIETRSYELPDPHGGRSIVIYRSDAG